MQLFVSEWEEFEAEREELEAEREELAQLRAELEVGLADVHHLTGNTHEKQQQLQWRAESRSCCSHVHKNIEKSRDRSVTLMT